MGPTVGVVSASLGGDYSGSLLGGIAAGVRAVGGRLVTIRTMDAGVFAFDFDDPTLLRAEVAWDRVSGLIVTVNSADATYLSAFRRTGKPVVTVSDLVEGFACPAVLPDNGSGISAAVRHLVDHGHRRIAFAGHLVQRDIRERHAAYRQALRDLGIAPDPALFYESGSNVLRGGTDVARFLIRDGMPATALIAGTDLNAVGIMRTLAEAGYEVPRDLAVIGFDDSAVAAHQTPSLSSVRQPIREIGVRAVELLVDLVEGRPAAPGPHLMPTELVVRESCGCPPALVLDDLSHPSGACSADELAEQMTGILCHGRIERVRDAGAVRVAARTLVDVLDRAARGSDGSPQPELRATFEGLERLSGDPERLTRLIHCLHAYGRNLVASPRYRADRSVAERVEAAVRGLSIGLSQADARAQRTDTNRFVETLVEQYTLSVHLLGSDREDPRTLAWLRHTDARAGCLGLWPGGVGAAGQDRLAVVASFDRDGARQRQEPGPVTTRAFPPQELVDLADLDDDLFCYVAPLRVRGRDRGWLSLVGRLEADLPTGRETMNQWAALLTVALEHRDMMQSLREQEEQLRHAALYDELTDLPNRALFLDRLRQAVLHTRRGAPRFAVLMLDLDGFKVVNDSLGHLVGDQLLIEVAARIRTCLRDVDTAARFGGDEFAILLEEAGDAEGAIRIAERLQASVSRPYTLDGEEVAISVSIGVAVGVPEYEDAIDILRDADAAMYWAKSREKGTHAIFHPTMRERALLRLRTQGELRQALDAGELEAHFQPIVDLDDGRSASCEALIRWRHPGRGLVQPAEFLQIAEECGLSVPIGRWMLEQACGQLQVWRSTVAGAEDLRVSVNISNRQFWRQPLLAEVADALRRHRIPPGRLVLEITEGVVMHDAELARAKLADLHDLGVELHIDDFGTGYSSLDALHNLPIDALKIDRSFVAGIDGAATSRELVRTIVLMAANLGLDVIAEGIETRAQCDYLRELRCRYGQGFLFSRPVPAGDRGCLVEGSPWADAVSPPRVALPVPPEVPRASRRSVPS